MTDTKNIKLHKFFANLITITRSPISVIYYLRNTAHKELYLAFTTLNSILDLLAKNSKISMRNFPIEFCYSDEMKNNLWKELTYKQYYYTYHWQNGNILNMFCLRYQLIQKLNCFCPNNDDLSFLSNIIRKNQSSLIISGYKLSKKIIAVIHDQDNYTSIMSFTSPIIASSIENLKTVQIEISTII